MVAVRASDDEREAVVDQLRTAAGEGRLTLDDLADRLDRALTAVTRAELEPLTSDLPGRSAPAPAGGKARRWIVGFMGGGNHRGRWRVASRCTVVNLMGGAGLDLTGATVEDAETEIRVFSLMGGSEIIVPDGVHVELSGFAFMGGNDIRAQEGPPPPASAPVVRVRAYSVMGGTTIRGRVGRPRETGATQRGGQGAERVWWAAIEAGEVDKWYGLGLLLASQPGRADDAERAFRAAIEVGDTRAWTDLGDLLSRVGGRNTECERAYREALESGDRRAWVSLGNLLYRHTGREREAEDAYRAAIEAGYPGGWLGVGNLLARHGRDSEAEQVYREALRSGVSKEDAGMLWRNLGDLLERDTGRWQEAERAYRTAIEAGEDGAWHSLGWLLAKQPGREREAERAYRKAVELGHASASLDLRALLLERRPGRRRPRRR